MSSFELRVADWYTVVAVEKNDFLNAKLDSEQYGIWYSIQFEGNAEGYLWQTKTAPVKGEKYWGWLEKTSSGKSTKFKWDKQNAPAEDAEAFSGSTSGSSSKPVQTAAPVDWDAKNASIKAQFAIKAAIQFLSTNELADIDLVEQYAKDFFHMVPRVAESKVDLISDTFGEVEVLH